MYLITRNRIFIFIILLGISICLFGLLSFLLIKDTEVNIKFLKEHILYYLILLFLTLSLLTITIFISGRNVNKKLTRMLKLMGNGSFRTDRTENEIEEFGAIGSKFKKIAAEISNLNQLRIRKIMYLNSLIEFLLENIQLEIVTLSRNGIIENCSSYFIKRNKIDENELMGKQFKNFFSGKDIDDLFSDKSIPSWPKQCNFNYKSQRKMFTIEGLIPLTDPVEGIILILKKGVPPKEILSEKPEAVKKKHFSLKDIFKKMS